MSARVINISERRRAVRDRNSSRYQPRARAVQVSYEITPEDINSFMCCRAIRKAFLISPWNFTAGLGIIGLLYIGLVFAFTIVF